VPHDDLARTPTRPAWAVALVVTLVAGVIIGVAQLRVDGLVDSDSYFHSALAGWLLDHGLSRSFPWTSFSTWRDGFADYNPPFHVWVAPFMALGGAGGAKLGSSLLAVVFVGLLATLPVRHRLRGGGLWSLLVLALGWHLWFRLLPVRPHVLSMLLTLLWLDAHLAGRQRAMFGVAFVLAWNHFSAPLIVGLAAVAALARRHPSGTWDLRALRATALGVGLGYVLNPYVPQNLVAAYHGVVVMFTMAFGARELPAGLFGSATFSTSTPLPS